MWWAESKIGYTYILTISLGLYLCVIYPVNIRRSCFVNWHSKAKLKHGKYEVIFNTHSSALDLKVIYPVFLVSRIHKHINSLSCSNSSKIEIPLFTVTSKSYCERTFYPAFVFKFVYIFASKTTGVKCAGIIS